jgi:hypothetical protein
VALEASEADQWIFVGTQTEIRLLSLRNGTVRNVERQNVKRQNVKRQNVKRQNVERQNVKRQNVKRQNVKRQNVKKWTDAHVHTLMTSPPTSIVAADIFLPKFSTFPPTTFILIAQGMEKNDSKNFQSTVISKIAAASAGSRYFLAFSSKHRTLFASFPNERVVRAWKVSLPFPGNENDWSTVAGNSNPCLGNLNCGDGGLASEASLAFPKVSKFFLI